MRPTVSRRRLLRDHHRRKQLPQTTVTPAGLGEGALAKLPRRASAKPLLPAPARTVARMRQRIHHEKAIPANAASQINSAGNKVIYNYVPPRNNVNYIFQCLALQHNRELSGTL